VAAGRRALDAARPGAPLAAMEEASLALAADPRSAAAWSLAAAAWAGQVAEGAVAAGEGWARSRPFLERALALDPDEPDALTTRAFLRWLAQWDWAGAEADLARAIAAHPGAAAPRALRSELWVFSGRVAGAEQEAAAAVVRAPRSPRIRLTAGMVAALAGDEEEAARHYRAVLELDPEHPRARRQLAKLAAPRPAPRDEPAGELGPGELEALAAKGRMSPGVVAVLYAEAGAADQALDWLERAVAAHDATVLFVPFDPRWEPWRDHPRYREAMGRLRRPLPTVS
jgi:tetratricopeptide (TPR) repeat protein